jgi:hypothetical protein
MTDPVDPPSYGDRQGERRAREDRRKEVDRRHNYPGRGRMARRIEGATWTILLVGILVGLAIGALFFFGAAWQPFFHR